MSENIGPLSIAVDPGPEVSPTTHFTPRRSRRQVRATTKRQEFDAVCTKFCARFDQQRHGPFMAGYLITTGVDL